jgi:hypothetical protein
MKSLMTRASILAVAILAGGVGLEGTAPVASRGVVRHRATRQVTIPAGTVLRLRVDRGFGSDISRVEETVSATLARPVDVGGRTVLRGGSAVSGYVAQAVRPGKVKGRGRIAVRFTRVTPAGANEAYKMQTRSWVAIAPATKKRDALTVGVPAAGGAVIGGLVGGKKGAGVGALAGGGGGTAVVLSTRGKEVRVSRGALLSVRLTAPLTINIPE